jgi:hypothetical protein
MFLRVVRATVSKGVKREYVRLVEAYRDRAGKTQHRTVLNLGRKDLLADVDASNNDMIGILPRPACSAGVGHGVDPRLGG